MKVCEKKKIPIAHFVDLPPPSIYPHELRWTDSGAISGFGCTFIPQVYLTHSKITLSWADIPAVPLLCDSDHFLWNLAQWTYLKEFSDARSPRRLNFILWRLIFVGLWCGTCFMLPFWRLAFLPGSWTFGKSVHPCNNYRNLGLASKYWDFICIACFLTHFFSPKKEKVGFCDHRALCVNFHIVLCEVRAEPDELLSTIDCK
jgi:hypothetical protein